MSHWTNSTGQLVGAGSQSGTATTVNFDVVVVPGNQTIVTPGNYTWSYHLNMVSPSGQSGPIKVASAIAINGDRQLHTRCFTEIDSGARDFLCHTGEFRQLDAGDALTVVVHVDHKDDVDNTIRLVPRRCSLTLRRVVGAGS